ncbi:hypothetical protein [Streptomyces hygroscopicus]|uniref:hypothetical protein n=1 Tax=Streptomyces hygroscopicus TaxID=1912 RepID=UPI001FCAB05C|nr:hypothetical protein [Streptomyces hygroscopicus]BDH09035.1 hypothetical protein HOK021_02140 [Streptomyces hygroscopicus]
MRALEDIRNKVRSHSSRRYIDEAVAAYGGGAYRSALIAIWIAVAADIIEKIRLLADEGNGKAAPLRDELNRAIAAGNRADLQKFERSLLQVAHEDLELIGQRESVEMARLYEDRNLCAHPAFVSGDDDLFSPTAELVRVHLTAAIDGVLSHGAVTGRKAIERFGREVSSNSFPKNDARLAEHLKASYMDHGTAQLRSNLIKVVCKKTLDLELDLEQRWRHARTARELQKIAPTEFEEHARSVLGRKQNDLDDEGLMALVTGLCYVPGTWDVLHAGTRARIEQLLREVPAKDLLETYELFVGVLPVAPLDRMLLERLDSITDVSTSRLARDLASYLGEEPDRRLIEPLIKMVEDAGSYQGGESVLKWINALAPSLTEDELQRILEAAATNDQIFGSVLGNRQLSVLRSNGPQGDQAKAAWAKWDAPLGAEDTGTPETA